MKDRLLTTDEIKKYHWIYISPASIETTIAILQEQDKKSVAANNAVWREKICSEETTFRIAAIILKYSKQLECGKCVIPLEEDCYGGDTEVQIAKEITGLLSEMEGK